MEIDCYSFYDDDHAGLSLKRSAREKEGLK